MRVKAPSLLLKNGRRIGRANKRSLFTGTIQR